MRDDLANFIGYRILLGAFAAVVVQWGTTGAAIIIAYLTTVAGLGCRSGSYIIYGFLGTISWLSLVLAMIFSHLAVLQHQLQQQDPNNDVEKDEGPRAQVQANGQEEPALNGTGQGVNAGHRGSGQETNSGGSQARLRIYSSLAVAFRLLEDLSLSSMGSG
jgi:hypothetical protein